MERGEGRAGLIHQEHRGVIGAKWYVSVVSVTIDDGDTCACSGCGLCDLYIVGAPLWPYRSRVRSLVPSP